MNPLYNPVLFAQQLALMSINWTLALTVLPVVAAKKRTEPSA
jgi:hypothetical protein